MSSWGNSAAASNSVSFGAQVVFAGSGAANKASNNTTLYANVTSDSFIPGQVVGQWPVTVTEMANTSAERKDVTAAGWVLRSAYEGPLLSVTAQNGSLFANGETVTVSNGSVNASVILTTNATGNLSSGSVGGLNAGGRFVNTGVLVFTFDREQHLSGLTAVGAFGLIKIAASGGSITGYNNTDLIQVGNGSILNATANIITNSTGGFVSANLTVVNAGMFPNPTVNTNLVFTVYASNGALSNGTGATFTGNLSAQTIVGYTNTDIIQAGNGVINAVGSVLTNATGGFVTANLTVSANLGLWSNAATNSSVVVTVYAANGALSNGYGAFLTGNLATSTGGTISAPVLGGRAGRVFYETLVAMGSMSGSGTSVPSSS